jgi:hypothetical protein
MISDLSSLTKIQEFTSRNGSISLTCLNLAVSYQDTKEGNQCHDEKRA